ncbi:MAG: ABC transporter permease [Anaerolineae bacterium]|nr:ABC transporter permease [Anaerolineae bacterium]
MWWRFRKHRMAMFSSVLLGLFALIAIFCEFVAPYSPDSYDVTYSFAPPQPIRFFRDGRLVSPFVYGLKGSRDPKTLALVFEPNPEAVHPVRFLVRGEPYRLWGTFTSNVHLFGVEEPGTFFLLGADRMGRDQFSRIVYGARISLSIGLVGVFLSLILGIVLGGVSGYYGGIVDTIMQRLIEFLRSIPTIPLWLALSAALPKEWSVLRVYFGITIILSLIGWTSMARVVRGRFLALREEDFVMSALLVGASEARVIMRHMVPAFTSHIIAQLTLSIPAMILSETSLSFLGLGLRPPVISWGVLLREAQNVRTVATAPWLMWPGVFVVLAVLSFNFVGDGLRDAADPYAR